MYEDYTPDVHLEIAYQNKATEEIITINDTVTPKSRFPPNEYTKLYETASVKVRIKQGND